MVQKSIDNFFKYASIQVVKNVMSGEQYTSIDLKNNHIASKNATSVDINKLRARLREEKNKEKTSNYIFLGVVVTAVAVTGIIASI